MKFCNNCGASLSGTETYTLYTLKVGSYEYMILRICDKCINKVSIFRIEKKTYYDNCQICKKVINNNVRRDKFHIYMTRTNSAKCYIFCIDCTLKIMIDKDIHRLFTIIRNKIPKDRFA